MIYLIILLALFVIVCLLFFIAQPIWAMVNCANSDDKKKSKSFWIISLLLLGPLAGIFYGCFKTSSKTLRISTIIFGSPLIIASILSVFLYVKYPEEFSKYYRDNALGKKKSVNERNLEIDAGEVKNNANETSKSLDASILLNKGQYKEGVDSLTVILEKNPKDIDSLISRGKAYQKLSNLEKSESDLNRAIEIATSDIESNPKNALSYMQRGRAFLYLKDFTRSKADLNKAIELDPSDTIAKIALSSVESIEELSQSMSDLERIEK